MDAAILTQIATVIVPLGTLFVAWLGLRSKASQTFASDLAARLLIVEKQLRDCEHAELELSDRIMAAMKENLAYIQQIAELQRKLSGLA